MNNWKQSCIKTNEISVFLIIILLNDGGDNDS